MPGVYSAALMINQTFGNEYVASVLNKECSQLHLVPAVKVSGHCCKLVHVFNEEK